MGHENKGYSKTTESKQASGKASCSQAKETGNKNSKVSTGAEYKTPRVNSNNRESYTRPRSNTGSSLNQPNGWTSSYSRQQSGCSGGNSHGRNSSGEWSAGGGGRGGEGGGGHHKKRGSNSYDTASLSSCGSNQSRNSDYSFLASGREGEIVVEKESKTLVLATSKRSLTPPEDMRHNVQGYERTEGKTVVKTVKKLSIKKIDSQPPSSLTSPRNSSIFTR